MPQPRRVLIVEDNRDDAEIIARQLRRMDRISVSSTTVARGIEDGLALLDREDFDLVLLDMVLPNGSGLDMVRRVRQSPGKLPIVILTGAARPGDELAALRAGAQAFLTKSEMSPTSLQQKIEHAEARHEFYLTSIGGAGEVEKLTLASERARHEREDGDGVS